MPNVTLSTVKNSYDVIIIGSGIAGLTCGAYLAKDSLKVLIVESHYVPGGYCTIFKRDGFTFDVGVHYLGNVNENGIIGKIIKDLDLKLDLIRIDPSDVLVMPNHKIIFRNSFEETIHNLQTAFPEEKANIEKFCKRLNDDNFLTLYGLCRKKTFRNLLNEYFKDEQLKSVFCVMLGNIGLPSTRVAALTAAVMYRDYIFRGGYYPRGSMQKFATELATKFRNYGGDLLLKNEVTKIEVSNGKVTGVWIGSHFISCNFVVSNSSARQTFLDLIGSDHLPKELDSKLNSLVSSPSAFIVYFSLKGSLNGSSQSNTWYCPSYDIDGVYEDCYKGRVNTDGFLFCALPSLHDPSLSRPGYECGHLIILVPYKDEKYWSENKKQITEKLINTTNAIVPGFSSKIDGIYPATPNTIIKYTKADRGSIYGWASTLSQIGNTMPQETFIPNLFLAGHWSTLESGQGGLTMVAYSGRNASKLIKNKFSKKTISL